LPVIGAGILEPEFEVHPDPKIAHLLPMLALRNVFSARWSNNPTDRTAMPWGAGLCVAREAATHYVELVQQLNIDSLLDRRGNQLFSAGDDLFSWASARAGKGFGLFPELRVVHLISADRLERAYFLRLIHNWWLSHGVLHYMLMGVSPSRITPERVARLLLGGLRHGLFHLKCKMAAARGEEQARCFISENHLQPLNPAL
jgi:hypothetical protein